MAFYELTSDCLRAIPDTTFSAAGIRERADLQRILRSQIEIIAEDTLIIAEEFGDWEDSNRRIDLLGLDKDANLIVFELKRTEDGGHMELQALRYASMVSTMTFEKVEEVYEGYLRGLGQDTDARSAILGFLEWEEADENLFAQEVRIVLVSAEFSKELTTSVIWLNKQGLDIRCIRIKPYADSGRLLVDVQRIIPLPEADDYTIRIRAKQDRDKVARESSHDYTKYDLTLGGSTYPRQNKRWAIFRVIKHLCASGVTPEDICRVASRFVTAFRSVNSHVTTGEEFIALLNANVSIDCKPFDAKRFFCGDDELIRCGGKTWAFSNQWGTRTFSFIGELKKAFPDKDIICSPSP